MIHHPPRYKRPDSLCPNTSLVRSEPMTATSLSLQRATDPYCLAGGEPGGRGRNTVIRADGRRESLKGSDETEMQAGDVFLIETPGGGGYGKTAERREAAE